MSDMTLAGNTHSKTKISMAMNNKEATGIQNVSWNLEDLAKATRLLQQAAVHTIFSNEFDMRRIFCMVYDVYRRKYNPI